MQDRFKFRGYHPVIGEVMDISKIDYHERIAYFTYGDGFNIDEVKLMQCTGLKDKNCKLIYEADIVKITKEDWRKDLYSLIYLVCWDRTQWQLGLLKWQRPKAQRNRRSDRQFPFKNIVSFDDYTPNKFFAQCEVIGNIYENEDLLKCENQ